MCLSCIWVVLHASSSRPTTVFSVLIEQGQNRTFWGQCRPHGRLWKDMFARDGKTVLDDADAGQECSSRHRTQPLPDSASLGSRSALPHTPRSGLKSLRRRLGFDQLAAERLCRHWGEGNLYYVFDVKLVTSKMAMAGSCTKVEVR
jgi:hypothetical protein